MSSAISPGPHNVFVYGSLLSDDVVSALLKRVPRSSPALLKDYHRFSIKERVYPAILPVEGKQVDGRVLMGLTVPELDILDVFEDVEYVRDLVEVSLVENTEKVQAFTYVWDDKDDPNLYGDWNFGEWKQQHMSDFLKMTKDFVEEFEQPDAKTRVETYESHYQKDDNNKATALEATLGMKPKEYRIILHNLLWELKFALNWRYHDHGRSFLHMIESMIPRTSTPE